MLQPVYEFEDSVSMATKSSSLQASVVPIIQQHLRDTIVPGNPSSGQPGGDMDGASENSNESFDENMSEQG